MSYLNKDLRSIQNSSKKQVVRKRNTSLNSHRLAEIISWRWNPKKKSSTLNGTWKTRATLAYWRIRRRIWAWIWRRKQEPSMSLWRKKIEAVSLNFQRKSSKNAKTCLRSTETTSFSSVLFSEGSMSNYHMMSLLFAWSYMRLLNKSMSQWTLKRADQTSKISQ